LLIWEAAGHPTIGTTRMLRALRVFRTGQSYIISRRKNMKIPFYQVDAFSRKIFGGNPAAVCLLESWLESDLLQSIAAENNLSETAFLVPKSKGRYDLRWFTPTVEVDLCGHATLMLLRLLLQHRVRSRILYRAFSHQMPASLRIP
jgi:predicted PhzF superfamily epimerase YddE/YHI9